MPKLTLGSLFDGSGGFPLAGLLSNIQPIWSAEIEPFPIRVTSKRLPFVKHYGDVTKLNGANIEPVDIITFGSPCQDLSIAGKRKGLEGSRSNLFFEAIRIVKEMRLKTNDEKPKYIVWENVPGAFSSNKGEDFRSVLESICQIKDSRISVPRPKKWEHSGGILGVGFSLAWRQFNAQYWGVPQRRKRIYLVADFDSECAGKILFESEGLSWYTPQGFRAWKETPRGVAESLGKTIGYGIDGYNSAMDDVAATLGVNCGMSTGRNGALVLNEQGGNRMDITEEMTWTLREGTVPAAVIKNVISLDYHPTDSRIGIEGSNAIQTLTSRMGTGGNNVPLILELCSGKDVGGKEPLINDWIHSDYSVRRLTPMECARLQGFPDWWCCNLETNNPTKEEITKWHEIFADYYKAIGKTSQTKTDKQIIAYLQNPHSDAAEYKMWGNGIALPNAYFVLSGIAFVADSNSEK